MTLTQLKYIIALADYKSFAAAAEQCFVAQPTLSLQVKKLEQAIGIELFDRSHTPLQPTPDGTKFIQQARQVMAEVEQLKNITEKEKNIPEGTLKLGIIPTIACYILPKLIEQLEKKYPKLDLWIKEIPSAEIVTQLEQNRIDMGLLATPLKLKNTTEIPLYYEPFVVYPSPKINYKKDLFELADLKNYPLVLLGDEHCFRNQSLKLCNYAANTKFECNSLETVKALVTTKETITLLPELYTQQHQLKTLNFPSPSPARCVGLITKKELF